MILTAYAQGAAHDPQLREQGYGAIMRDFYGRAVAGYAQGVVEGLPSLGELSHLVSTANRMYHSEQALAQALRINQETGFDQEITGRMIARDFDAASGAGFAYPAQMRIRFELTTELEGEQVTRWVTYEPPIEGPGSVAMLQEMIEQAGIAHAETYGETYVSAGGAVSITYA